MLSIVMHVFFLNFDNETNSAYNLSLYCLTILFDTLPFTDMILLENSNRQPRKTRDCEFAQNWFLGA